MRHGMMVGLLAIGIETSMSSCCRRDHATLYSLSLSTLYTVASAELEYSSGYIRVSLATYVLPVHVVYM